MFVPQLATFSVSRYWTLAGNRIYFVTNEKQTGTLESFDLTNSKLHKLGTIPDGLLAGIPGLFADPIGSYLLLMQQDRRRNTIMLQELATGN